jgi:DNA replication protein DnaC
MLISNVPEIFQNAIASDFEEKRQYSFENRESLFITGLCGTGKTHLAVALGNMAMINKPKDLRVSESNFISYPEFVVDIKCSFGETAYKSMRNLISNLSGGFLILDDICTSKNPTPIDVDTLYLIVNERYQRRIPTIYTSNLTLKEIGAAYNDRIASRLSACRIIELTGKDRRLQMKSCSG